MSDKAEIDEHLRAAYNMLVQRNTINGSNFDKLLEAVEKIREARTIVKDYMYG